MTDALTPEQIQVLTRIRRAWPDRKLALIGAAALGVHLPMTWRRTDDLDLTVVSDAASVVIDLQSLGLQRHPKLEQRWSMPGTRVRIDILAASDADLASGRLVFAQSGQVMNLTGFDLAFRHARPFLLEAETAIDVATMPVIAILKMAAWLDRPSERDRDLEDLGYASAEYLAADDMSRWDDPRLAETAFEHQSALALGLDIADIAGARHRQLIAKFLAAIDEPDSVPFARLAIASTGTFPDPADAFRSRLDVFRAGLARASG